MDWRFFWSFKVGAMQLLGMLHGDAVNILAEKKCRPGLVQQTQKNPWSLFDSSVTCIGHLSKLEPAFSDKCLQISAIARSINILPSFNQLVHRLHTTNGPIIQSSHSINPKSKQSNHVMICRCRVTSVSRSHLIAFSLQNNALERDNKTHEVWFTNGYPLSETWWTILNASQQPTRKLR